MAETDYNKYVFGAYLNMALDNFLNTVKLLAAKMKVDYEEGSPASIIKKIFDNENMSPNVENIVEFYFPWMKALMSGLGYDKGYRDLENIKDFYAKVLRAFAYCMNDFRNFYTHTIHVSQKIEPIQYTINGQKKTCRIADALDMIYDSAVNLVKERFVADEADLTHLRRFNSKGKKKTEADGFVYLLHDDSKLTEKGIAFVTCLFLNRKYGYLFLKQLSHFKRSDERRYQFTLETFLAFSNIKPVDKLKSDKLDRFSLGMDMLNELTKIPRELIKIIPHSFVEKYFSTGEEEYFRSRIRYKSRFEQLALEFISQIDEFKDIRFYTYYGSEVKKGYMKQLIDGTETERYLTDSVCGFCRSLNDYTSDDKAREKGKKIKDPNEPGYMLPDAFEPHILRAEPHFIINNNNIGIKIGEADSKGRKDSEKNEEPDFWLSIYELPAMLFYAYLRSNREYKKRCSNRSVRDILEQYRNSKPEPRRRRTDSTEDLMLHRIKKELRWTDTKLAENDRIKNNVAYGKKGHRSNKTGTIADILAHDMIRLQPARCGGDKVTGANFRALQTSLAYFRRDILGDVFKRAMLTAGDHPHPFLNKIDVAHCTSLRDFYVEYLNKRKEYFEKVARKIASGKLNTPCHLLRDLQRSPDDKVSEDRHAPVFLPRGIFTDSIKDCLKKTSLSKVINNARNEKPSINAAFLITQFYTEIQHGKFQEFYNQRRKYDYIDKKNHLTLEERKVAMAKLKPEKIDIRKANDPISKEEYLRRKEYKKVCDNESAIRLYQVQDVLMWLMVKHIFADSLSDISENNISLDSLNDLFEMPVKYTPKFRNITVSANQIKIKDYGKIRRLGRDTKFISLVKAIDKISQKPFTIDYADYLQEEDNFEKYRICMVKICQDIEDRIVKLLDLELAEGDTNFNFNSQIITPYNERYKILSKDEESFIIDTRNMFMHSEYKDLDVNYVIDHDYGGKLTDVFFSEKIYGHFVGLVEKIGKDIEKRTENKALMNDRL